MKKLLNAIAKIVLFNSTFFIGLANISYTFATTTNKEVNKISSSPFMSLGFFGAIFWIVVIYLIIRKIRNTSQLKKVEKEDKNKYYESIKNMTREEQFNELTEVVRKIISEGYQRNQGNLCRRVTAILKITSCPIKYKTLSAFRKEGYQDVIKSRNPYELIGFSKIEPDGKVTLIVAPNISKMSTDDGERLNRINTGDDYTPLYPVTYSELIKNNPNIDVVELIKTLESRC